MTRAIHFPKGFETVENMVKTEAFEEGQLAYYEDRPATANPYPLPGTLAAEWERGFNEAEREWRKAGDTDVWLGDGEFGGES